MNFTGKNEPPPTVDLSLSSSASYNHHHSHHQPHQSFLAPSPYDHHQHHSGWLVDGHRQVGGPELSSHQEEAAAAGGWMMVEREHMFDKVVTPSDVGKLNRLVIPKQHAERYFPLDSSSNDKGLLLNFEDRIGKLWRFRYSYWNSSQSYVMTKGWSRFVKEKKLDAGDIVSFQRGVGDNAKDRLFIDWRHRVDASGSRLSSSFLPSSFPHHNFVHPWNPLVFRPIPTFQRRNFNSIPQPFSNNFRASNEINGGSRSVICFGPGDWRGQIPSSASQTPSVSGKASGKRLRLFGVNMDCPLDENEINQDRDLLNESINTTIVTSSTMNPFSMGSNNYANYYNDGHSSLLIPQPPSSSSNSTIPYLQLRPHGGRTGSNPNMILSSSPAHDFNTISKSKASNISLDLDI